MKREPLNARAAAERVRIAKETAAPMDAGGVWRTRLATLPGGEKGKHIDEWWARAEARRCAGQSHDDAERDAFNDMAQRYPRVPS